ncbi:MAG TPA: gephyrin-like molybdotransferase Glp, partial [Burkholderiaceae bacterium]|nr:gephyrin-like molybdotransferase Glp [Burkholderiaceae bacterium]
MLDFDVAQTRLATAASPAAQSEKVSLSDCIGRVLAKPVIATLDLPSADNSAMDGYAIRHADYQPDMRFPIQQRCYAGDTPEALQPGKAIRLFTGSIMPEGADTVVMQENAREENDEVIFIDTPAKGRHVRYRGEDVKQGTEVVAPGTVLGAAQVALIASQGIAEVDVFPQLKVGLLTTGDELVAPGQPRAPEQIYNSNGPMLSAMLKRQGVESVTALHAQDTPESITQAFETLLSECDLVLTVGGVSVGDKDLVKPTIEQLGGTLDLWRVNMKPGKPVALAHARNKPIVCLPGNPVSAFVVYTLLVSPLVRTMQGRTQALPAAHYGTLDFDRSYNDSRIAFLRAQAHFDKNSLPRLIPHNDQGSAIISSLSWADV